MGTYSHQYNSTLQCDNVIYFPVSFTASKFPLAPINVTFIDARNVPNEDSNKIDLWRQNGEENEVNEETVCKKRDDDNNMSNNAERYHISFKINAPQDQLESFGIWGRIYARDVYHTKDTSEEDIQAFNNILDVIYEASDKNTSH